MSSSNCRWGILSTAGIAKKNWRAIRRSGNGTVIAVASRNRSSAQKFIDECQSYEPFEQPPEAVDGYQALLDRKDIDAVYIPLPTGLRTEWVLAAARAGKHIVAEKPAGVDAGEVETIIETCRQNGVQYMDGVMFMHSARLPQLRSTLNDGKSVGNIRRIATQFSFCSDAEFRSKNIRSSSHAEPHGALGDLGWYCIRMILWTLDWKMPTQVQGRTLNHFQGEGSPKSVPSEFSAELLFDDGVSASIYCSFQTQHQQWAHISGDKGFVFVPDFVLPFHSAEVGYEVSNDMFLIDGCDFNMERHLRRESVREYSSGRLPSQEVNLFKRFNQIVLSGELQPEWGQMTLNTQRVLDALFQSSQQGSAAIKL